MRRSAVGFVLPIAAMALTSLGFCGSAEAVGASHQSLITATSGGTPGSMATSVSDPATDPADLALVAPLSAGESAIQSERQAAATQFYETGSTSVNPMTLAPVASPNTQGTIQPNNLGGGGGSSAPASATLAKHQQTQVTDTWCGPTSVLQSILTLDPNSTSTQSGLASALKTSSAGTAWSGVDVDSSPTTGYPVPDILNNRLSGEGAYYLPASLMGTSITSTVTTDFKSDVVSDVANGWPVVPNIDILNGANRPANYPPNEAIQHWVTIYGYSGTGGTVDVEDPAGGMGGNWSNLARYWSTSAANMLDYVDQRGYVW